MRRVIGSILSLVCICYGFFVYPQPTTIASQVLFSSITVQQQKERWWEPLPMQPAPTTLTPPILADVTASAVQRRDDWVRIVVQTFNENDFEIALVENEFTRQPRKLTDNSAADLFPRLNVGATEVVFASNRDGNFEIYRIGVDGANSVRLTTTPFTDTMPVWSPDGQQIAFVSTRTGNADLFVMGRDGSQPTQITRDGADDLFPSWTPVGNRLAWVRRNGTQRTLWVANADGSNARTISGALPWLAHPVWSPDGQRLAFDYDASGDGWNDLAMINADGSGLRLLGSLAPRQELWMGSWYTDDPTSGGKGERLLVTRVEYFLDASGRVIDLFGSTQKFFPCCESAEPTWIAVPERELLPDAQRSDLWAPASHVLPLPTYLRAEAAPIRWQGSDKGPSGLAFYDVQYRTADSSTWQEWRQQAIETTALYIGTPGQQIYFRSRAIDRAENLEVWPTADEGDATTTLFQWQLRGQAMDNRGVPEPLTPIAINPAPLIPATTDRAGNYDAYLTSSGAYQIQESTTANLNSDWHANVYRAPVDASLITKTMTLGHSCVGICMAPAMGGDPHWQTNSSSMAFALAAASDHSVHLLWTNHATRQLFYQKRTPSGGWQAAELVNFGDSPQTTLALAVDAQNTVHAFWAAKGSNAGIQYTQRPQAGAWTVPLAVGWGDDSFAMKLDPRGGIHLLYTCSSSACQGGLYYQEQLPSGAWQQPLKVADWQEQRALTIHTRADSAVQLAWIGTQNANNMSANTHLAVLQKERSATGNWGPIGVGFTGYDLQVGQLAFDANGRLRLLWTEQSWSVNGSTFYVEETGRNQWSSPQALIRHAFDYSYQLLRDATDTWHLLATPPYFQMTTPLQRYQPSSGNWSNPTPAHQEAVNFRILTSATAPHGQMHFIVEDGHNSYGYRTTKVATQPATFAQTFAISVPATLRNPTLTFFYDLVSASVTPQFLVTIQPGKNGLPGDVPILFATHPVHQQLAWLDLTPWSGEKITVTFTLQQAANEPYRHVTLRDMMVGAWTTPVITDVTPSQVDTGIAARLTITGQNFLAPLTILAGATPLVDLNVVSETQVEATVPANIGPGVYDLFITSGTQRSARPNALAVGQQLYLPIISR